MDKLKIGIICYPSYGGSGVIATELGMALAKRNHSIHFISYETPFRLNTFDQNVHFHEVNIQSYPLFKYPPYTLALTSKIVEVCEVYGLDILHVHYAIPHSICAFLAKQILKDRGVKFITTLHGTDITLVGLEKSYYNLVRFGILESDTITTVSQYLKDVTTEQFKIDKEIKVVPNSVDIDKFSPIKKNPNCHLAHMDEKLIIHISNFRPVKNIESMIRTFYHIQKETNSKLALIGDGPEISTARSLAIELDILNRVNFLSKVEAVEDILPYADLFLLTSKQESFGLALLEAMSCGIPTISSNVGGIPEVVQEGKTGFIFDPDDHESMAKKAIEILTQPALHKTLSQNSRARAVNQFNLENNVLLYEQAYLDTLKQS